MNIRNGHVRKSTAEKNGDFFLGATENERKFF